MNGAESVPKQTKTSHLIVYTTSCVIMTIAMPTVVPDDEVFRVKLRKSNSLRFSGQCLLEILR